MRRPYIEDMYPVLVPPEATEEIPQGAALLEVQRGTGFVFFSPDESFAESCTQAVKRGRTVLVPENSRLAGVFSEHDGELHLQDAQLLEKWIGRRIWRNELEARDNRSERHRRARRLMMQGQVAEAFRIDPRGGL